MNNSQSPKGHLLMLVHRVPYPPNKGDKIRSFNLLKFLAARGWQIHLCAIADDPADLHHGRVLDQYCASVCIVPINPKLQKIKSLAAPLRGQPLSSEYFYRSELQQKVNKILATQPVTGVLCFCSPMAEYLFRSDAGLGDFSDCSRLVMDLVDVDSDKWRQYAKKTSWPMKWVYQLESRLLQDYEQKVVDSFDATALVSEDEAQMLRQRTGHPKKIYGIANGVDIHYFSPTADTQPSASKRLVFCGAMDYFPNVDAVVWFARQVLPLVRESAGEVEFDIVGGNPTEEVKALAKLPGVRVTGRVEDVRPYVQAADLSVAPIRIARGLQNKVLEAMAMGKAVLSTPEAFEGIEAVPGRDLQVTPAQPQAFAEAVRDLMNNPVERQALGRRARQIVEKSYCWDARLEGFESLFAVPKATPEQERGAV